MRALRPGTRWSTGRLLRRGRYAAYIASDDWFRRREHWYRDFIARTGAKPACAVCRDAWTLDRGDLHHRTYDRLGAEADHDLVPLCRRDHDALHAVWDTAPFWRRLGRSQATAGIIMLLRRELNGTRT